ncbi:hypothetical protein ACLOJK_038579 [Asimina triloba]
MERSAAFDDISVMSGATLFIKDDLKLDDTKIEVLMGIINLYSLVGSAMAGQTSDWIGWRWTLIVDAIIFFLGAAGAPVYTAEVAPASCRGYLTSFPEVFINLGVLLGYISNFGFAKLPEHLSWRMMLGVGAVTPVFLALGALLMPESSRWLIMQGQLGEAKKVLARTLDSKEEAEVRMAEIKAAAGIPEHCTNDVVEEGVWRELLLRRTPSVRRILIATVRIHFFQQASGVDVVVLYSPTIFGKAGIKPKEGKLGAAMAVGFSKTIYILVATFYLDRVGRRPLLLSSAFGMIVSLLGLAFGLTMVDRRPHEKLEWAVVICIITVLTFVGTFSIGLGPLPWVYGPEILPLRLRAQGMSLAVAANRVTSGVIGMTFLSLSKAITIGGAFFLFADIAIVAWIFFYTFLPETRGKTLEEMESLFVKAKDLNKGGNGNQVQLGTAANGQANGHEQQ